MLRATENTNVEAECVGGIAPVCSIKSAVPINRMLGQALKAFVGVLDQHTLADLIGSRPPDRARVKPRSARSSRLTGAVGT